MEKKTFIEYNGRKFETYNDLVELYNIKSEKFLKDNPQSNEFDFIKIEREVYKPFLAEVDIAKEPPGSFPRIVFKFLADYFNGKSMVAEHKFGPVPDEYPRYVKWFDDQVSAIKNDDLLLTFIDQQIDKNESAALSRLNNGIDLNDRHRKAEFEAGQKFIEYIKNYRRKYFIKQFKKIDEDVVWKINPTGNFEKLKQHRLSLFENIRKKKFILSRKEARLVITAFELDQCFLYWLQDELKVIDSWLSENYPNGGKKGFKQTDSNRVEIEKYQRYVKQEINRIISTGPFSTAVGNEKPIGSTNRNIKSFDDLPQYEALFVLRILEYLKVTKDDQYQLNGKKNIIRSVVESSIENNLLPAIGVHPLNEIIARKIKMPLNSKLTRSFYIDSDKRKINAFIKENYKPH